jgi:hypothetical protein
MSQILDRLWLGSAEDVSSFLFLRAIKATHILSCAVECPPSRYPSAVTGGLTIRHIPLEDDENGGEPEDVVEGARTLHEWLDINEAAGHVVFTHCMAGISRSPTIVIAYLILFKGMGYREAWDFVAAKRNFIRPHPYWEGILQGLEVVREAVLAAGTPPVTGGP